jgi:hypothetical protein
LTILQAEMLSHCDQAECGYNLEFFLYRNSVRKSRRQIDTFYRQYDYRGRRPGFYLKVIELPELGRFMGVFCRRLAVNLPLESGYTISSPRLLGYGMWGMYPAPNWPATNSLDYDPVAQVSR